jgi:hypothetical protein
MYFLVIIKLQTYKDPALENEDETLDSSSMMLVSSKYRICFAVLCMSILVVTKLRIYIVYVNKIVNVILASSPLYLVNPAARSYCRLLVVDRWRIIS